MLGYLQLIRPLNCLMASAGVLIGGLLILKGFPTPNLLLAALIAFMITGAGNAINDYVDVEADKINRPKRPIPSGRVSKNSCLAFSFMMFAVPIFIAGFINWLVFLIALINSLLLILYSFLFQHKLLIGNIIVSYLVASTFLFGGAALGNILLPALLAFLAGFTNLSREIVKDLEDIEGDRASILKRLTRKAKEKVFSIAERFGIRAGKVELKYKKLLVWSASISLAIAIAASPLPYVLRILTINYIYILIPADTALFSVILMLARKDRHNYSFMSKLIKVGMFLGLLAFIFGIL